MVTMSSDIIFSSGISDYSMLLVSTIQLLVERLSQSIAELLRRYYSFISQDPDDAEYQN